MTRTRTILVIAAAAAVVAGGITYAVASGGSSSASSQTVIFSRVEARNLQSTVNLTGTLARKSLRNIDAASQGIVSALPTTAGQSVGSAQTLFAIGGRPAITEQGLISFFRSLVPGDQGQDVVQLKQILAAAGDYPGPPTDMFTQQTQFALAQWQAQNGYPSSTPATNESATVSLQQGAGYKVGDQSSTGLVIGPPTRSTGLQAAVVGRGGGARPATFLSNPDPVLTIQSVADQVSQGQTAVFVISASSAPVSALPINLNIGGTATSQQIITPASTALLAAGAFSTEVVVQTRVLNTVGPNSSVAISLAPGSGYVVGAPATAATVIADTTVPTLTISGGTSVTPGGVATLTVTSDQAPVGDLQVALAVAGSAQPGSAYDPVDPVAVLPAGRTSVQVTLTTVASSTIEPSSYAVVSIAPSPGNYNVGSPGSAVVTIAGSNGLPTVTLSSATTYLQKGSPYIVQIGLSQAVSTPTTIQLSYAGTSVPGVDYVVPPGNVIVPAGQTAAQVQIPTVTDNTVRANTLLTVSLAPSGSYAIGSPNTASVTINSTVVPTLDISASSPAVSQGGAATLTITADQAPTQAISVAFVVQGTAQPGQNYVPVPGFALLPAGQTSVTVVLQTLQTNITFEPTDMIVGQWPSRIGTVNVKVGAAVAPGEPILSLTEPQLSVTLQATAAQRSQLQVGQPCTVQIDGATSQGHGVITELDDNATSVTASTGGSSQVYEGTIQVPDFTGANGSQVSITVVDQQVDNALTVPIAAVLQNGSGVDVVRTVDLANHGHITAVPVTTGLTQGSYIQVTGGLSAGQVILVGVNATP